MIARIINSVLFPKKPAHLILNVSKKCNLRCKTCFVDFDKYEKEEISLNEIEKLSKYLNKLMWLDISGGEPFLRNDLPEICSIFNTESITIPTNGFAPELISDLTKRIRNNTDAELAIVLSLDGFEETHDEIRNKGSFQKATETLGLLKKIHGIRIKINTVLCEKNYNEIIPFMKFIKTYDVDFHSVIFLRGIARDHTFKCPDYERLYSIKDEIFKMWDTYNYGFGMLSARILKNYQKMMYLTSIEVMKQKRQIPRCLAGRFHLVVYPDGNVAFCELLDSFGNLKEESIKTLLKSEKAERQRNEISEGKCYCYHNCNMLDNYFLNPLKYFELIKGV